MGLDQGWDWDLDQDLDLDLDQVQWESIIMEVRV
jgi:hypothetical protein